MLEPEHDGEQAQGAAPPGLPIQDGETRGEVLPGVQQQARVDPFAETRRALAELEAQSAALRQKLAGGAKQAEAPRPATVVGAPPSHPSDSEAMPAPAAVGPAPSSGELAGPLLEAAIGRSEPGLVPLEPPARVDRVARQFAEAIPATTRLADAPVDMSPVDMAPVEMPSADASERTERPRPAAEPDRRPRGPRVRRRTLVAVCALALLSLVGGGAWRAHQVAVGSHERLAALRESFEAPSGSVTATSGTQEGGDGAAVAAAAPDAVRQVCAEAETINRELGPMPELAGVAGSAAQVVGKVPQIGDHAAGLMALASASADTIAALRTACEVIEPLVSAPASGTDVSALVTTLGAGRERLRGAVGRLRSAQTQLETIDPRALNEAERGIYQVLARRLPSVAARLALMAELPGLLGYDGPRTFLVLGQNGDELRPTGGFIGTAGLLSFDQGRLVDRQYGSSFGWDLPADRRVTAPEPLQRHMGAGYWQLKESNWMPDFPTAAQQARFFHEQVRPEQLAGVVAIDQNVVELLLEVTGPVEVPQYGEVVNAANVRERMEHHTHYVENWGERERKGFVSALFMVLMERLNGLPRERFGHLAAVLERAVDRQYVQVWAVDDRAQQALADLGWDGRMLSTDGDYLYAVSANVAMNKINREVEQALGYEVTTDQGGRLVGRATLTLRNRRPTTDPGPYPTADLRDYLRVYVPDGSELISATGFDESVTAGSECGRTVFGGLVTVKPGTERQIQLSYRLPGRIREQDYRLLVQQQPGTDPYPLSVRAFIGPETASSRLDGASSLAWADGRLVPAEQRTVAQTATTAPVCAVRTEPPQVLQPPRQIVIPKINVRADTVELGVQPDGFLEAPKTGGVVGWYRDTARPGQVGNLIASGHVDWEGQAAVFSRLHELRKGDLVEVVAQDGVRYRYQVDWMKSFDPVNAPLSDILGPTTQRWLTFITCGGTFNQTTRQYSERLVVRARLVGTE